MRIVWAVLASCAVSLCVAQKPNVVVILADDLGYGDIGAYNRDSKIPTPNLDRLAAEGLRFTDAHSPSAVCTPTRYGLLTGRYAWRTRLKSWVLNGYSRSLIDPGTPTIASRLQAAGYRTAVVGKWHLGLGTTQPADYSSRFDQGPHTVGFDESYVIPASLDMPPYGYVVDGLMQELPTAETPGDTQRRNGGGGFWRKGAMSPSFDFYRVLPNITEQAINFIERQSEDPFFLYVPLPAPHTPWMPIERFRGKSGAGWYGDFVVQVDDTVGQVVQALRSAGKLDNTLLIFTSDNGAHWLPRDISQFGHRANAQWRGQKADIHEAGHRIPFIMRWPGRVAAGEEFDGLVGLNDLYATIAEVVGLQLSDEEAPDSRSFLRAAMGETGARIRRHLVHHSADGMFALRVGQWKYIEGLGSGGFTQPARIEPTPGGPQGQLYDLAADPGETKNLWMERPNLRQDMARLLQSLRGDDR